MASQRICTMDGCGKQALAKGFCPMHYRRFRIHGDPAHVEGTEWGSAKRFIMAALVCVGDECLIWPFNRTDAGYANNTGSGPGGNVSRFICSKIHGSPPTPKHEAAHSCGNGHLGCVNPKHLRWATSVENKLDVHLQGRKPPMAKLSAKDIPEILDRISKGERDQSIADDFGVSQYPIYAIRVGKSWRHILRGGTSP